MTEVPKIVYDRLRSTSSSTIRPDLAVPGQTHPDADLLAGLSEQALSATERDQVLAHLALCSNCREVVALALPAEVETGQILEEVDHASSSSTPFKTKASADWKSSGRFAWPVLQWAALAAGVALAASILIIHPGKLNQGSQSSESRSTASLEQPGDRQGIAPATTNQTSSAYARSGDTNSLDAKTTKTSDKDAKTNTSKDYARTEVQTEVQPLPGQLRADEALGHASNQASGMLIARNRRESGSVNPGPVNNLADRSASGASSSADRKIDIPTTNAVVDASAYGAVDSSPSPKFSPSPQVQVRVKELAQNQAPAIEKAKPAPKATEAESTTSLVDTNSAPVGSRQTAMQARSMAKLASSQSSAPNVSWTITAGVLQKSVDGGLNWQSSLRSDHPLSCYASHDQDVWAGGKAGTLFHSADGGLTWVQIKPSFNSQPLDSDITHLEFRGESRANSPVAASAAPLEIIVSTSNREIWSSIDNGNNWTKK